MKLFGLTGGIGTGKSTAANLLSRRGIPVIEPGCPALAEVTAAFGCELLDERGELRRAALAETVFSSAEKLKQLEAILHPRIRERWLAQVDQWRRESRAVAVVVIPLLFETDAQTEFDSIVCTACSAVTQRERLRERGWTEQQLRQRLAAQWPLEKKMAAADFVVWTECDPAMHERQLVRIFG
jgi:dephospho-CoA kinase